MSKELTQFLPVVPDLGEKGSSFPLTELPGQEIENFASGIIGSEMHINRLLPNLKAHESTAIILDINNLFRRAHTNGFAIDYAALRSIFAKRCDLRYHAAASAVDSDDIKARKWVNYMLSQNYDMIRKDLKRFVNSQNVATSKGNMDVEITIAAMRLSEGFSHIILGSCDSDFIPLITELKKGHHRKVSVLGLTNPDNSGVSESLKRAGDNFYDLRLLKDYVSYRKKPND